MAKAPAPAPRKPGTAPAKPAAKAAPAKTAAPAQRTAPAKAAPAPAAAAKPAAAAPQRQAAPAQQRQAAPAATQQRSNVPAQRQAGTAVAKVDPKMAMMMEDAGQTASDFETKDLAIPFIRILQSNSPQVNKRGDAYVDGAEPSHIFNTALERAYDGETGIYAIVCKYQRQYTEWKPRIDDEDGKGSGGGFVMSHGTDDSIMRETTQNAKKKNILANGNEIVESADYFVIAFDPADGSLQKAVISMSSTQWKAARKLNNQISGWSKPRPDGKGTFNPAPYSRVYLFTTVPQSNDKGDFFGWKVEPGDETMDLDGGKDLYLTARDFRRSIEGGHVKAAAPVVADADEPGAHEAEDDQGGDFDGGQEEPVANEEIQEDDDEAPHAQPAEDDDDIPFD